MTATKQCTGPCRESYPATPAYFHRDKRLPGGLKYKCKICVGNYMRHLRAGINRAPADPASRVIDLFKHNKMVIELNDKSAEKVQKLRNEISVFEKAIDIDIINKLKEVLKTVTVRITLEVE